MKMKISYHPRFLDEKQTYSEIDDWYDGRLSRVIKYLIPHQSESNNTPESSRAWEARRARTTNENDMKPAVKIHVGHLAQPVEWGKFGEEPRLAPVLDDVSGLGDSPERFFIKSFTKYVLHGFLGIYVEGPEIAPDAPEETINDVQESRSHSFQILFDAHSIRNWARFSSGPYRGQLSSVLVARGVVEFEGNKGERLDLFEIRPGKNFTRTELFVKKGEKPDKEGGIPATVIARFQGNVPEIPIVLIGEGLESTVMGDVAQRHNSLFNQTSIYDSINYYQGFKWSIITGARAEEISARSEFQVTLVSNENASVHTIESGDPTAIASRCEGMRYRLRRLAMFDMNALTNDESKMIQSAESKEHDVQGRKEIYDTILTDFEKSFSHVYRLHAFYEGAPALYGDKSAMIKFGRNFKLTDPISEITRSNLVFSQATVLGAQQTRKEIFRQNVIANVETDPDTMTELMAEIDAMPDTMPEPEYNPLPGLASASTNPLGDIE